MSIFNCPQVAGQFQGRFVVHQWNGGFILLLEADIALIQEKNDDMKPLVVSISQLNHELTLS